MLTQRQINPIAYADLGCHPSANSVPHLFTYINDAPGKLGNIIAERSLGTQWHHSVHNPCQGGVFGAVHHQAGDLLRLLDAIDRPDRLTLGVPGPAGLKLRRDRVEIGLDNLTLVRFVTTRSWARPGR